MMLIKRNIRSRRPTPRRDIFVAGALAAYHESANNMLMPIRKARDFFVAAVALMRRLQKKFEDDRQAAEECNTFAVPWAIKDLAEKSILAKSKNPRINIRNKRDGVVHVHPPSRTYK